MADTRIIKGILCGALCGVLLDIGVGLVGPLLWLLFGGLLGELVAVALSV